MGALLSPLLSSLLPPFLSPLLSPLCRLRCAGACSSPTRYLPSWALSSRRLTWPGQSRDGPSRSTADTSHGRPVSCPDAALNAFAQLAALRLGCDRAFVSIFDDSHQYILTEATRTTPLHRRSTADEHGDALVYGTAVVPREPTSPSGAPLPGLPLSDLSIADLAGPWILADARAGGASQQRVFATSYPGTRFYAVVPIRTPGGYNIGTICVLDRAPRSEVSDADKRLLSDVSETVMEHLERCRTTANHQRSLKLFEALGCLVKYDTSGGDGPLAVKEAVEGARSAASSPDQPATESAPQSPGEDPPVSPWSFNDQPRVVGALPSLLPQHDQPDKKPPVKRLFTRTSSLLAEVSDAGGVVFFDATTVDLSRPRQLPGQNSLEHHAASRASDRSFRTCDILGSNRGWSRRGSVDAQVVFEGGPREEVLLNMLRQYRSGGIFQIDESGNVLSSGGPGNPRRGSGAQHFHSQLSDSASDLPSRPCDAAVESEVQEVLRSLPGARSVAFFPLWDVQRNRWYAAGFAWSTDPKARLFLDDDLTYLRAFGNCIMAAVACQDALLIEMQKATFMSMMSHELRSPLHGILANVELFHDIKLQPLQIALLNTVEACSRTMLDVVNHLLDYAEMVKTVESPKSGKVGPGGEVHSSQEDALSVYAYRDIVDLSVVMGEDLSINHARVTYPHADLSCRRSHCVAHHR